MIDYVLVKKMTLSLKLQRLKPYEDNGCDLGTPADKPWSVCLLSLCRLQKYRERWQHCLGFRAFTPSALTASLGLREMPCFLMFMTGIAASSQVEHDWVITDKQELRRGLQGIWRMRRGLDYCTFMANWSFRFQIWTLAICTRTSWRSWAENVSVVYAVSKITSQRNFLFPAIIE